jgi:hypothetical protein
LSDGIQFTKKDSPNDKITIPYGTDLTNYNKATFRQSIIDHTLINSPYNTLKETITSDQKYAITMKTLVGEGVFPKTTNTLLTVYFSDIPQTTGSTYKSLIQYYCSNEEYPTIKISIVNSGTQSPELYIEIFENYGIIYSGYKITPNTPKLVIDLTAVLAEARPEEKITDAKFPVSGYGKYSEMFYKDCVNILSNVFISYTYDE